MSRLASKLAKLKHQTGYGVSPGSSMDTGVDAGDGRLRAELGRRTRARPTGKPSAPGRCSVEALAERVGGECVSEALIVIRKQVPLRVRQGRISVGSGVCESLQRFGHENASPLFLDTETTGLCGGTGTHVFLIGIAKIDGDQIELRQLLLTRCQGESAMLDHAAAFAPDTDLLVTYNGKSFDLPLLATRYRLAGIHDPFAGRAHLDLLHTTQRAFRRVWADCTLRSAERRLLGFERVGDLPGALAPQTWFEWLRAGTIGYLPGVIEHNRIDVLSLSALTTALGQAYERPLEHGADLLGIARGLERERSDSAAYDFLLAHRDHLGAEASLELALLARRRRDWRLAVAAWSPLAERDHPQAIEGLAKYHEHVDRDLARALQLTEQLLRVDGRDARHAQRRQRLIAKGARIC